MKNDVTGLAGAVRIQQMKMDDLTRAEKHGKRLDGTSKARAIYDAPPLTSTGLDLNNLYRKHVHGAFMPRARAKAMHVIVQYPTDLVDGEDAALMLRHACAFIERVFGPDAIFADRVDRDEKGRHVVDVFVAPKYMKVTKHAAKLAVSMSRDLKNLATEYDHPTNPYGTGRALQDAWFDYLRKDMGLEQAQRGSPKLITGPDWKSAEELRVEELEALKAKADADLAVAELARREAEAKKSAAIAEEAAAKAVRSDAVAYEEASRHLIDQQKAELREAEQQLQRNKALIEVEQADTRRLVEKSQEETRALHEAAQAERERQKNISHEVETLRGQAEGDRHEAAILRKKADEGRTEAKRVKDEAEELRARAEKEANRLAEEMLLRQREMRQLMAEAQRQLAAAKEDKEKIEKDRVTLRHERNAVTAERQRDLSRLDLLERAMDDSNGLRLRPAGESFKMDEQRMSEVERQAYGAEWPKALSKIARRLAIVLERFRKLFKLAGDERDALAKRQEQVSRAEAAVSARDSHAAALERHLAHRQYLDEKRQAKVEESSRRLDERKRLIDAREAGLAQQAGKAAIQIGEANRRLLEVQADSTANAEWGQILEGLNTGLIVLTGQERADWKILSTVAARPIALHLQVRVSVPGPAWAEQGVKAYAALMNSLGKVGDLEEALQVREKQLTEMIAQAGPALSPAQEKVVSKATNLLRQSLGAAQQAARQSGQDQGR